MGIAFSVFVSYSHKDSDVVIPAIDLQQDLMYASFLDFRNTPAGSPWMETHAKAIRNATTFMLAWSRNAAASEHVTREWRLALEARVKILPVLMDDTPLPDELGQIHALTGFRPLIRDLRSCRRFPWLVKNARAFGTAFLCLATAAIVAIGSGAIGQGGRPLISPINIVLLGLALLAAFLAAYTFRLASRSAGLTQAMTRLVIEELKANYAKEAHHVGKAAVATGLLPKPLCPSCHKPLPTLMAKQCFECGETWHSRPEPARKARGAARERRKKPGSVA